ncbi:MAG TPA: tRNA (adenosine(37)-N6)-dimethylallyltransferase MiaA [Parapedobacter sp.]|uniref:tRNA (adenosine(37)-N6)-dimethylallyltransferase MiaA n=1 Tax=Parapedobacter sp. TaxID=1958893 RepID=UPI002C968F4B|nr:tRNA (adenosine(37)-N6)-dimethylallyltransferase MiaA [Parapedobacter sp.]HWK56979.1 tRNA (adenosine(37)-N6)-dimethylallyltransferase MiaA [Parapedobacter sp.]
MADAKTLICVVGPTAVGKTTAGIQLAEHFQTVILSADSRQFYREMTIGTAKPSDEELAAVPHYFINSHHITEDYSAGDFERDALSLLAKLFLQHDVVVLVGGSGLFVRAICQGLDNLPKPLPGVRDRLNDLYRQKGLAPLRSLLQQVDPEYFHEMDTQNPQRVIRALEVYESTGMPFSHFRRGQAAKRLFNVVTIGLDTNREVLYQRINSRVDAMVAAGLLDEVESLLPYRHKAPLQTVGYAEWFDYLDGKCSRAEAVAKMKQNTRRYAKRQLTWFRKDAATAWFAPEDIAGMIAYASYRINPR